MLSLNVFTTTWHWIAGHWFAIIITIAIIIVVVKEIRRRTGAGRIGMRGLTWPAWRFNWKIVGWAFVFACLIVGYILFHNYQDNRRYIKALNRKNELAKTEMRKMEVIAQIPPKRFEEVEKVKATYEKPSSRYKPGTIVQKTVSCGQVVSIETAGQTYDLDGVSGNAMCLQVSNNGITWNKVPHRFTRSPQTLFVKNTGTDDVTFKATFR